MPYTRRRRAVIRTRRFIRRPRRTTRPRFRRGRGSWRNRFGGGWKRRRIGSRRLYPGRQGNIITKCPLPCTLWTKFRCQDEYLFNVTTTVRTHFLNFQANNPYDPILGTLPGKCSGYLDLMNIYRNCVCFAAKLQISGCSTSPIAQNVWMYILADDHNARHGSGPTNAWMGEQTKDCVKTVIRPYIMNETSRRLKMYRKTKDIEQISTLPIQQFGCTVTAGPAIQWYLQAGIIFVGTTQIAGDVGNTRADWKITFYCKLTDRINMDY